MGSPEYTAKVVPAPKIEIPRKTTSSAARDRLEVFGIEKPRSKSGSCRLAAVLPTYDTDIVQ
jgi:hypothetical protein